VSEKARDDHNKPVVNKADDRPAVNKALESDVAVDILAELRRQQQEQKQLIHEQRAIVNELRRHENVAHHLHDDDMYQVCGCDVCCDCTLCLKKTAPLRQGRHKFFYFPNTKKIRNIRFIGYFIRNKRCEIYYDDVTMTTFIGNK